MISEAADQPRHPTVMVAGLGPAGRGLLTTAYAQGILADLCREGLIVVDPDPEPGGGALRGYLVRSDSAAIVFAECVKALRDEPQVANSDALARVLALPDGESILLPDVGQLLDDSTSVLLRQVCDGGADLRLGQRLTSVTPRRSGGALVEMTNGAGGTEQLSVDRLVLAVGGRPYIPAEIAELQPGRVIHSDGFLRDRDLEATLSRLPPNPSIVIIGRAHSAFSVADRLLSSIASLDWPQGAVTLATRGSVRVTYPDAAAAIADGAHVTPDDICPKSNRVWRLCGLRGDAARRYRLSRDGFDPRLRIEQLSGAKLTAYAADADLIIAATGYRPHGLDLMPVGTMVNPDGSFSNSAGHHYPGIHSLGLGSGSRRHADFGGEASYDGPVDGVWHYQTVLAPAILEDLVANN